MNELQKKIEDAIWIGKSLFERGKVTGSSANMSFMHDGAIYITGSETCFGRLLPESFSRVAPEGSIEGIKPSKELPLHKMYYEKSNTIGAVIHIHSYYAVMYTFLKHKNMADVVPDYTPYLKMKVGRIGIVPYAQPGSEELFGYFKEALPKSDAFLLERHGSVVGAKSLMDAFYGIEELEESCRIAWMLDSLRYGRA